VITNDELWLKNEACEGEAHTALHNLGKKYYDISLLFYSKKIKVPEI